ncbi:MULTISPECIES: hypothetical protein [unclassified Serratia (in: enterobacteria)]|uniref:hypothetical protein n=1 Tax=unclassified Serratia (in: enterobacteria) TaxID=2647522 RepID=UPI0005060C72|nr:MULTISPECIES: hypothetical protein [unclassified Serratia (in: enterobacteria)]KFK95034.1 hypothetical protein IV04_21540 [Serratia sp. Ag1]KFK96675.1 hypothetical protein JV45_02835 [Serratia sp. Ag2]
MATRVLDLTAAWVKVTDGTNTVTVQVKSGLVRLVDSPTAPAVDAQGHVVDDWVTITPPTVGWIKSESAASTAAVVS